MHHNDLYDSVKETRMPEKSLILELNVKILSPNQIAGFLNFNISRTIGGITLIFCIQVHIY